jgi:hypothetical protein
VRVAIVMKIVFHNRASSGHMLKVSFISACLFI